MVRFIALISLFTLIWPANAYAAPVDIRDVKQELQNRGAVNLQIALLSGYPVISGAMDGQGFIAHMDDCHAGETICQKLSFKTCHANSSMERLVALEWANDYNQAQRPGVAYVNNEDNLGDVVCVKLNYNLIEDKTFGIKEAFAWTQTVEAFKQFLNEQERRALGRQILGR